jgi:hypothetical protein
MKETLIALAMAFTLYLGSYFALVSPVNDVDIVPDPMNATQGMFVIRNYRYGGDWSPKIFTPLEYIDRQARPRFWATGNCFLDFR